MRMGNSEHACTHGLTLLAWRFWRLLDADADAAPRWAPNVTRQPREFPVASKNGLSATPEGDHLPISGLPDQRDLSGKVLVFPCKWAENKLAVDRLRVRQKCFQSREQNLNMDQSDFCQQQICSHGFIITGRLNPNPSNESRSKQVKSRKK